MRIRLRGLMLWNNNYIKGAFKLKIKILLPLFLFSSFIFAQDKNKIVDMTPTGEEGQTLAKLKERVLKNRAELDTLDAQLYAIEAQKKLKQYDINNAIINLNNEADTIKKNHVKDWGDKVDYQPENPKSEYGVFVQVPLTKDEENLKKKKETKNGSENEIKKEGQKEGRKILKPKK
jgi:hypothetical protein